MNSFNSFSNIILSVIKLIVANLKSVEDVMVQTDDENLDKLLEKPSDRFKFQKAIDDVSKDLGSQDIILNGKNVTIST